MFTYFYIMLYLKSSLKPFIYKTNSNNNKKNEYKKNSNIRLLIKQNTSLRKQKNNLLIKNQIQNTNNIIYNIKFHTRITHRFLSTFICGIFIYRSFCITKPKTNKIQKRTDLQLNYIYIKNTHHILINLTIQKRNLIFR